MLISMNVMDMIFALCFAFQVFRGAAVDEPALALECLQEREQADALFNAVLKDHVRDGLVHYAAIKNDDRFITCLRIMERQNPDSIADRQYLLAFWINAYNAFTIKLICDNHPVRSIKDIGFGFLGSEYLTRSTAWDRKIATIHGRELSLNNIEHDIIRKIFDEPRIHFALVCAAKSCPPLRNEAYDGRRLDSQLDDQRRTFLSQTDKNRIDIPNRIIYLSKIFQWYSVDFNRRHRSVVDFVWPHFPDHMTRSVPDGPPFRIEYTDYDWTLNGY